MWRLTCVALSVAPITTLFQVVGWLGQSEAMPQSAIAGWAQIAAMPQAGTAGWLRQSVSSARISRTGASLRFAPTTPVGVDRRSLQRLARRVEPDLVGRRERLPQYIEFFCQQLANDPRLFAFDVTAGADADGGVRLEGFVEFPETRAALVSFLQVLGFKPLDDRLEVLPAAGLGTHRFGFVRVEHTLSYDRPAGRRQVVTDCLLAEPLYLLREEQEHVLVHSAEGYLGYVSSKDVHRVDETSFARYLAGPWVRLRLEQRTAAGNRLPAGCRLHKIRDEEDRVVVELPTGETLALAASCCEAPSDPTAQIDRAIDRARQLLGTSYLWGGKTSHGIDCSGLVQVAFAAAGIHLPRDSNQQIYLGQLTATRWCTATMRRGDTLYFLGPHGKIRHTAIYLGNGRYLQAESPVVRISSLDPQDANYDAARHASFAFAKRLLD